MVNIKILGSCSGTEPMPDRLHTSIAVTVNETVYFFDAGEGCARNAYLGGVALLNTRAVFISHSHFDHVGGLAGLFWTIRKLTVRYKQAVKDPNIELYSPQPEIWEPIHNMLRYSEGNFECNFSVVPKLASQGLLFKDENLSVSAYRAYHMPEPDGACRSLSFRLELPEKSVVFSGDVKKPAVLEEAVGDGCDILLMETGHHKVRDVCDFASKHNIGELILIHHGREILNNEPSVKEAINECPLKVTLSYDGMDISW